MSEINFIGEPNELWYVVRNMDGTFHRPAGKKGPRLYDKQSALTMVSTDWKHAEEFNRPRRYRDVLPVGLDPYYPALTP